MGPGKAFSFATDLSTSMVCAVGQFQFITYRRQTQRFSGITMPETNIGSDLRNGGWSFENESMKRHKEWPDFNNIYGRRLKNGT
jgi:hypothetical protein